jgi:adenine phosphoribosyltransferase
VRAVVGASPPSSGTTLRGAALVARMHELIRDVPDFPRPGVGFKDITPLLADAEAFAAVVAEIARRVDRPVDLVAGTEARGFILAAPVAVALGAGFVPVRKAGKLPGPTSSQEYDLEYGTATVEVQTFTVRPGSRVLIVDDVLATGGTAGATIRLFEECGAHVVGLSFLVDLRFLGGRARLEGRRVESLLNVL